MLKTIHALFPAVGGIAHDRMGVFIRLNRSAEELEPEAMREAKQEDRKVR